MGDDCFGILNKNKWDNAGLELEPLCYLWKLEDSISGMGQVVSVLF